MFWLLTRPVVWPLRSATLAAGTGYKAGRLLGVRRLTYIGIGVAIGLLVAPTTGRELRERLRELRERIAPSPPPLAAVVDLRVEPVASTA